MTEGSQGKTALWHSRLGHMNVNSLKILAEKGTSGQKGYQRF